MASVFDYIFNIGGNYSATINGMTAATGEFTAEVKKSQKWTDSLTGALARFDYLNSVVQNVAEGVNSLGAAGVSLDAQMHDLSAVAGVTGEGLKQIEGFARESALAFGTDASESVEGYKLLLSQLSPELGKYPEALSAMGACIHTTSKLMGGDGVAAAEVLTTAMNQYGVSLEDPMAASGEMARMMNVMAAAGQAGSAELPAISAALSQCGMAAKAANVSFEETNAAIQVLDKAGKKASEGGVALRNVLGQLGKGRFIEKQAAEELAAAGIDVVALADNSKTLKERLDMLKPLLNDSALLSKFFGVENANAARALIQGTDSLQDFTDAVTGTNSATEQAAIVMDSYAERQARVNQKIEDFKITLFQATGDLTLWCSAITSSMVPLAQLAPLFTIAGKSVGWFGGKLISCGSSSNTFATVASGAFSMFSKSAISACRSVSVAISSIPIVGWIAAIIALVGYLCVKFEWARYVFGVMIFGIGGILAIFVKNLYDKFYVVRLIVHTYWELLKAWWSWLYQKFNEFVGILSGYINAIVAYMTELWGKIRAFVLDLVKVFRETVQKIRNFFIQLRDFIVFAVNSIIDKICSICAPVGNALKNVASGIKSFFINVFNWIYDKYSSFINTIITLYNKLAEQLGWDKIKTLGKLAADKSWAEDHNSKSSDKKTSTNKSSKTSLTAQSTAEISETFASGLGAASNIGGSHSGSNVSGEGGADKIKNITINIEKLVERFEIHTATVGESAEQVKAVILETLTGALNDTQLAIS